MRFHALKQAGVFLGAMVAAGVLIGALVVGDLLKQEGHGLVEGIALADEEQAVKLGLPRTVELQIDDLVGVQPRQRDVLGVFEDFRIFK